MSEFHTSHREDYNHVVRYGKESTLCYSEEKLKQLHAEGGFDVVGELRAVPPKKKGAGSSAEGESAQGTAEEGSLGTVSLSGRTHSVRPFRAKGELLYKKAGYIPVGENKYLCIKTSRLPFLITLCAIVLAFLAAAIVILVLALNGVFGGDTQQGPNAIVPDHPLPDRDPSSLPVEGDEEGDKLVSEEGGGAVRMIYTSEATVNLSTGKIKIYFVNPQVSNQCAVIELYVLSGSERYLIGRSGRIDPDFGLLELTLDSSTVTLQPTDLFGYKGMYAVHFYDPETGERAIVSTDITDIDIYVLP